jgi:LPS export ABC transporter protein LptC
MFHVRPTVHRSAVARRHTLAMVAAACLATTASAAPPLRIEGLTFVATNESTAEVRVRAEAAVIDEAANKADLETVDAEWADDGGKLSLRIRCREGELDLASNDLLARGEVQGEFADGRRFVGPWLRYDRARGVAYTSAPVEIQEGSGRVLRGGGLEYHVRKRLLRLTSGARVEERGNR